MERRAIDDKSCPTFEVSANFQPPQAVDKIAPILRCPTLYVQDNGVLGYINRKAPLQSTEYPLVKSTELAPSRSLFLWCWAFLKSATRRHFAPPFRFKKFLKFVSRLSPTPMHPLLLAWKNERKSVPSHREWLTGIGWWVGGVVRNVVLSKRHAGLYWQGLKSNYSFYHSRTIHLNQVYGGGVHWRVLENYDLIQGITSRSYFKFR